MAGLPRLLRNPHGKPEVQLVAQQLLVREGVSPAPDLPTLVLFSSLFHQIEQEKESAAADDIQGILFCYERIRVREVKICRDICNDI